MRIKDECDLVAFECGEKNPKWRDGRRSHHLYYTYRHMIARCSYPDHQDYKNYGARGIQVCEEWREDFWAFTKAVGIRPQGMTLDRVNNDGNYEPGNVRWATKSEQQHNKRPPRTRKEIEADF